MEVLKNESLKEFGIEFLADEQYEIKVFREEIASKGQKADYILNEVVDTIAAKIVISEAAESESEELRYVVDMSSELISDIKSGKVKLDVNKKTGEIFAQLRDDKNRYGKKLPIKEELLEKGIDPVEAITAVQLKEIEQQLLNIVSVLDEIGEDVAAIIQGQQNDRIGLYYSGLNLYIESQSIQDPDFQKFISAQALKSLSDANAQMIQSIKSDMEYLFQKRYKENKKNSVAAIDEKVKSINKSFEVIYRTAVMKAAIYYDKNEIPAMLTVMEEFGKFLKNTIAPYAPKLTEFDVNDRSLKDGIWESRADLILEIEPIKERLAASNVYYLERKENQCG